MHKKKEIIGDYRKKIQELDAEVKHTRFRLVNKIKKHTLNHLVRLGEDEFEALELLEKLNDFTMECIKCGSEIKCINC